MKPHIKFYQDWPTGLWDIQVQKCEIFVTQGQVTPKWVVWLGPKIEFDQAYMPVLVTSNFDDDSIKNEQASMETPFSHYKSMVNFLDAQGQVTPYVVSGPIWSKFKLFWDFMPVLVPSNFDDDLIKNEQASMETAFSHYKSMGRAANSIVSSPIWPKFKLVWNFMHVLVTSRIKKDRIKNNREKVETSFSPL